MKLSQNLDTEFVILPLLAILVGVTHVTDFFSVVSTMILLIMAD